MATGSKPLIRRLILTFMLVTGLLKFCYEEDTLLSYGLRSAVRWEARAARQVAETLKDIRQRGTGRGRGSAFLPSRINYTANGNSTFQLHCIINARDVQTNPGPFGWLNGSALFSEWCPMLSPVGLGYLLDG